VPACRFPPGAAAWRARSHDRPATTSGHSFGRKSTPRTTALGRKPPSPETAKGGPPGRSYSASFRDQKLRDWLGKSDGFSRSAAARPQCLDVKLERQSELSFQQGPAIVARWLGFTVRAVSDQIWLAVRLLRENVPGSRQPVLKRGALLNPLWGEWPPGRPL